MLRDKILQSKDLKTVKLQIPEWDCEVIVSEMSGSMRDQFEQAYAKDKDILKTNIRAYYAVYTVVDENGDLIFKPEEVSILGKKNAKALDRIFEAAEKLNKIWTPVKDEAKNS